jgi:hypothetical protein
MVSDLPRFVLGVTSRLPSGPGTAAIIYQAAPKMLPGGVIESETQIR